VKGAYPHVAFTDFLHGRTGTFALWTGSGYVHVQYNCNTVITTSRTARTSSA
jgi:hypothetical protein